MLEAAKTSNSIPGRFAAVGRCCFDFNTDTTNEIELLVLVRPEFASAMDCEEVPPGGPGENSEVPNNIDFYINGHNEVPVKTTQC